MKSELAAVIDELLAGNLSPGRRYEKLDTYDDLYSVRLSRGIASYSCSTRIAGPLCPSPSVPTTTPTGEP